MNEKEFRIMINNTVLLIEDYHVFYALKEYGIKGVRKATSDAVKICICLDYLKMYITGELISFIKSSNSKGVHELLHRLGDKKILNLHGYNKHMLLYEMNIEFKAILRYDMFEHVLKEGLRGLNQ